MKLESFAIRQALEEGRHSEAVLAVLAHFSITLHSPEIKIKIDEDIGYGIRAWVGPQPYVWFDGDFWYPWSNKVKHYSGIDVVSATIFLK